MIQAGTGKRYGAHSERGQIEAWGGIVSARLSDYSGALNVEPEAVLDAVEVEGITPAVDTAEPKGRGRDRDRLTEPTLRCLTFSREDFARLVAAVTGGETQNSDPVALGAEG